MKAAIAIGLLLLTLTGCADPAKVISAASYRNAVERGLEGELAQRGVALAQRPDCRADGAERISSGEGFTARCAVSTVDGVPVSLEGAVTGAGTPGQRENYRVSLGGPELFQADCLGAGCPRSE